MTAAIKFGVGKFVSFFTAPVLPIVWQVRHSPLPSMITPCG